MEANDPIRDLLSQARQSISDLAEGKPLGAHRWVTRQEFEALQRDVARLERQLGQLEARVTALEEGEQQP